MLDRYDGSIRIYQVLLRPALLRIVFGMAAAEKCQPA